MPELPEVRTVAKVLKEKIIGKKITNYQIRYQNIIEDGSLSFDNLINKTILDITTYGKYLIFKIDNLYLVSHLRMEGKYYIKNINDEISKHEHIIFILDNNISLRYHDTRKFGRMFLTDDLSKCKGLNKLGLEPFDKNINSDYLLTKFNKSNLPIKELLLDQSIIAGLGNIYANEVLFLSKINVLKITFCKVNFVIFCLYYVLIILCLFNLKKGKKRIIFVLAMVIIVHSSINFVNNNYIMFMDVNQGDSTLVVVNKKTTLIDTGGILQLNKDKYDYNITNNRTIPYLKSKGIKKIDNLILTHGDYDHMGEAINIVNNFKVEKVIFNCGKFNDLEKELIKVLNKRKIKYYSCINELNIDNNKLYFLQTKEYDNENDNSNVIYTKINGYKFMFMGDAGVDKEKDILENYNISNIDVLKVGHHGSKTSSSKKFIDEANPKYGVISVGKNNKYGHPNKEILNTLSNSKIYRTDEDGSIMFKIKNNKLKIKTCSP